MKKRMRRLVVDAAMTLAAERGWAPLSLRDIAERAGVPLEALRRAGADKTAILGLFAREIDAAAAAVPLEGAAVDRLFDVVMARFDAMLVWRDGLRVIWRDLKSDPAAAAALARDAKASIKWTLEAAGIASDGALGAARVAALAAILLRAFACWLEDDRGQNKTMALLDKSLKRCDRLFEEDKLNLCGLFGGIRAAASSFKRRAGDAVKEAASASSRPRSAQPSDSKSDGDAEHGS